MTREGNSPDLRPRVTIAIPTYNRAALLIQSAASALSQEYRRFELIVLDNDSSDETARLAASLKHPKLRYVRNPKNIGLFRNWKRAVELSDTEYVALLQDDDVLLPRFLQASVDALDTHPSAGFSFSSVQGIDADGNTRALREDVAPAGLIDGLEYLHAMVAGRNWVIHASGVLMRRSALARIGNFDNPHSCHSIDVNLYFRLARYFGIVHIPEVLASIRRHSQAATVVNFGDKGTGPLAMLTERLDAVAHLMTSVRAEDPGYRIWLARRLLHLNARRSALLADQIAGLNLSWQEQSDVAREDLEANLPQNMEIILVDENQWNAQQLRKFRVLPFPERNGVYWGPPADGHAALEELERQHRYGRRFVVFAQPAFWWLDYYSELRDHLERNCKLRLRTSQVIIFEMPT